MTNPINAAILDVAHLLRKVFVPDKPVQSLHDVDLGSTSLCVDHQYGAGRYVIEISPVHYNWERNRDSDLHQWCIENKCQYGWYRVLWDKWTNRWSSNGIGGGDHLFIITDDEKTAVLAKLTWG